MNWLLHWICSHLICICHKIRLTKPAFIFLRTCVKQQSQARKAAKAVDAAAASDLACCGSAAALVTATRSELRVLQDWAPDIPDHSCWRRL